MAPRAGLSAMRMSRLNALLLTLVMASPAGAADRFHLDQRHGMIAFSVDHFGVFTSSATFGRFRGEVAIDQAHPENTRIDVEVDADSVTSAWKDGAALLRGPDFFDATRHRNIRFTSHSVTGVDPHHFRINGTLVIRGTSQPLTLDARVERRRTDPAEGAEAASFIVTGSLSRSAFGMTAHTVMIPDRIHLSITARLALPVRVQ